MTLWTLLGAFLPVAVLFVAVSLIRQRKATALSIAFCLAEALGVTLLGALWFTSLGHGGWFTVFLLIGALVAGAERGTRIAFLRSASGPEAVGFLVTLGRYLAAGALLAWRLT